MQHEHEGVENSPDLHVNFRRRFIDRDITNIVDAHPIGERRAGQRIGGAVDRGASVVERLALGVHPIVFEISGVWVGEQPLCEGCFAGASERERYNQAHG